MLPRRSKIGDLPRAATCPRQLSRGHDGQRSGAAWLLEPGYRFSLLVPWSLSEAPRVSSSQL